ncbi:hypothetical protein DN752_21130 [Echinicola strongylocentroti]|uniref:Uncharacterized protein n=1 Tax=Echinicola strongylocentroti TaxID=1795355 RepID=A0A2Z4INT7_9BACT|nr:hypothetical protein [Echinicola strongylocentroti]AWW32447.1 hypothetical protein DN752_21130 [Echinicola strongylocentroti]
MTTIEIKYPFLKYFTWTHRVKLPGSWNELSRKQLITVAGLLHDDHNSIHHFRVKVLKALLKLSHLQVMMIGAAYFVELWKYIPFLEEGNELTDNKVLTIKTPAGKLYGPVGNFETLTAKEWTEADEAFLDFHQTKQMADLDRLVAILYRPKKKGLKPDSPDFENDYRIPFNEFQVPKRSFALKTIHPDIKLAVLVWYQGCRMEWEAVFERVFKGAQSERENFGWQETIQKLSGEAFGDHKETENTSMYKLMLNMEITLKDEEHRKEMEKANRMKHAH